MASLSSNSPATESGSNDAAILYATIAQADFFRTRGQEATARRLDPSLMRLTVYYRCKCSLLRPAFIRTTWNLARMALACEAACIIAIHQGWSWSLSFALFSAFVMFLMAVVVMFFATFTPRSRAMLETILLPRKKWEEHLAQGNCGCDTYQGV